MSDAQMWAGITRGLAKTVDNMSQSDARAAAQAEARARQSKAEMELQEFQQGSDMRQRTDELQMQQLEAQTRTINSQLTKQQTFGAFSLFEADNDVRHLNTWLAEVKNNPVGASLYGDVVRFDPLVKTEETDKLLRSMGYEDLDAVYADPELSKDLVLATGTEQRGIVNMNDMYAGTGYTKYMTNENLKTLEAKARVNNALRAGERGSTVSLKERVVNDLIKSGKASSVSEAYTQLNDMGKAKSGRGVLTTTEERAVDRIMQSENVEYLEALDMYYSTRRQSSGETNESRFTEAYLANNPDASYEEATGEYRNLSKTSTQKEIKDVKGLRDGLDKIDWLDTNVGEMTNSERAKVYSKYISPIEDLRNFKLSSDDKKTVRKLRGLSALGGVAGSELTPSETGLVDSMLNEFKKYIFDEVGGKAATSAYATFRNIYVNSLYGSDLTAREAKAYKEAAGTLGQKFQPVLAQFKTQLETVKTGLSAINELNDPYIAHYYLGRPLEDIDDVLDAIDQRLRDPNLRLERGEEIRVTKKGTSSEFDFDAAMKGAGL